MIIQTTTCQLPPQTPPFTQPKSDGRESPVLSEKDSGVELDDLCPPDDVTCNKILSTVENLFSDENLAKDAFLLKHVKRNKEGYVSLKLISSLRKVKSVTKNWRHVAHSIKKFSTKLIINDDATKVRRVDPLPASLDPKVNKKANAIDRQILLVNLPREKFQVECVSEIVSAYGTINEVRLYQSINGQEFDHLLKAFPRLTNSPCALVEFDSPANAMAALLAIQANNRTNWRFTIQAFSLKNPVQIQNVAKFNEKQVSSSSRRRAHTINELQSSREKIESRKKSDSCSSLNTSSPRTKMDKEDTFIIRQPRGPSATCRGFATSPP